VFRVPGFRGWLTGNQESAVIKVDQRALDWTMTDPEEIAADGAAHDDEARANPKRSALLDKLRTDQPVIVEWAMLRRRMPADGRPWFNSRRTTPYLRVDVDDRVEPADGPPDQCQW
jgi:hypothetical protein